MLDFFGGMAGLRGRIDLVGELDWSDPKADAVAFADEIRQLMVDGLADMRGGSDA